MCYGSAKRSGLQSWLRSLGAAVILIKSLVIRFSVYSSVQFMSVLSSSQ